MNRRNFLKSMGALAATAASATSFAVMAQPNKYSESIRLLDACRDITDEKLMCSRLDMLLAHLRENFPAPEATPAIIAAARVVLEPGWVELAEAGIRGIPPNVADDIYPVALLKLGFKVYDFQLGSPDNMELFNWFHKTYGLIILTAATPVKPKPNPRTAEQIQNDNLAWVNRQVNQVEWSPTWEEDMKLFNIKGRA
jgi:hypothetical protein